MNHKFLKNHLSLNITKRLVLKIGVKSHLLFKRTVFMEQCAVRNTQGRLENNMITLVK